MWLQASDTGRTTFSKCFVVPSVTLGGEFSFCFPLGQIQPGDKISSQILEVGVASAKAEGCIWENALVQKQEWFPCRHKESKELRTETFLCPCKKPVLLQEHWNSGSGVLPGIGSSSSGPALQDWASSHKVV